MDRRWAEGGIRLAREWTSLAVQCSREQCVYTHKTALPHPIAPPLPLPFEIPVSAMLPLPLLGIVLSTLSGYF